MTTTPSARLSRWYRLLLVMLFVAVVGAVGPSGHALADATVASPSPAEPCQTNELDVSSDINPIATAYAPGQVGTDQASLHNSTSVAFTDAYFEFQLVAPVGTTAPATAPTMSLSIDGGAWPGLTLSWTNAQVPQSSPFWRSNDIALPTLAPGSTHTLRFQAVFHGDSPTGFYDGILTIHARACFNANLGMTANIEYDYYTDLGRTGCCIGANHSSSPAGGAGAGKPTPVPPTAPVSATTGAPGASTAPTDSSSTVISATPSASGTPTANQARGASAKGPPEIAWLGALLILAVAGLLSFWGRIVSPGRVPGPARLSYRYRSLRLRPPKMDIDDDSTTDPADRNR